MSLDPAAMTGGFDDGPIQSARAFRAALDALSRPGKILTLTGAAPPMPLSQAAGVLLLTLVDGTTPMYVAGAWDCARVRDWITFHCAAPLVGPAEAVFAVGDWPALQPVGRFAIGRADYPDRAATLIVEMTVLSQAGARLIGPGIAVATHLSLPEITAFQNNHALFPLGFDAFLTCGDRLAGLPRSTRVEAV